MLIFLTLSPFDLFDGFHVQKSPYLDLKLSSNLSKMSSVRNKDMTFVVVSMSLSPKDLFVPVYCPTPADPWTHIKSSLMIVTSKKNLFLLVEQSFINFLLI